jgi:hypothetical protein
MREQDKIMELARELHKNGEITDTELRNTYVAQYMRPFIN